MHSLERIKISCSRKEFNLTSSALQPLSKSLYRFSPTTDPRCPEGSRTMAQDGGKVVSLTHQPPLPPGNTPGTHFCQRLSRPRGHSAIGRILCR